MLGTAAQMQMGAACEEEEEAAEADEVTPPSLQQTLHASLSIWCLWIELVPVKVMPQMSQQLPDGLEWPLTFGIVPGGALLGLSHTYFHPHLHCAMAIVPLAAGLESFLSWQSRWHSI